MQNVRIKKLILLVVLLLVIWHKETANAKLVAYWNFDEGSGTIIKDATGNGNTGILHNMTGNSWGPGKVGTALKFDGMDDYIIVQDSAEIEFGQSSFSISFWMKNIYIEGKPGVILIKGTSGGEFPGATGRRYCITNYNEGKLFFVVDDDIIKGPILPHTPFSTGDWVHVVIVRDKGNVYRMYRNTVLVDRYSNQVGDINSMDEPLIIGAEQVIDNTPGTYNHFYNGMLDELQLFDHALTEDEVKNLYEAGALPDKVLMSELVGKIVIVETLVNSQKYQEAITLVEREVAELKQRAKQQPHEASGISKWLPDLYFNLAIACEKTDSPQKDIIKAYKNAVFSNRNRWKALIWLIDNSPKHEYEHLIEKLLQDTDAFSSATETLCRYFALKNDWLTFELFLDAVTDITKNSVASAEQIYKCLNDNWREQYLEYCKANPNLADFVTKKRSELKSDITLKHLETNYKICNNLFQNGSYNRAIQEIDQFLAENKSTDREKSLQAILKKGRCYIHLGEFDKASRVFRTYITQYPDSEQLPEATFYAGYCNMLQDKYSLAREVFDSVIKDYPKSSFANKAKLCLERIKSMARQK